MEREERKKKEAIEISMKRKEKEEKNLATKQRNEELIMERRKRLIEKYTQSEEKIKKQKEDNEKELMDKNLQAAFKREDTAETLSRYERLQELGRLKKVQQIEERNERLDDMQKEKERINNEKRIMGANLAERKKLLMDKVSTILTSGNYKTKEDIYKKVFNDDELQTLGYGGSKTINSNSRKKSTVNENDEGFFLTQGNMNVANNED